MADTATPRAPGRDQRGAGAGQGRGGQGRGGQGKGRGGQGKGRGREEEGDDLIDKLVHINRVAKVVKGGRRFSFAALVTDVVGSDLVLVRHAKFLRLFVKQQIQQNATWYEFPFVRAGHFTMT